MRIGLTSSKPGRAQLLRWGLLASGLILAFQSLPVAAGFVEVVRPRYLCENVLSRGEWLQDWGVPASATQNFDVVVHGNLPGPTWLGAWASPLAPDYQIVLDGRYPLKMFLEDKRDIDHPVGTIPFPKLLATPNGPPHTLEFRHKNEVVYTLRLDSGSSKVREITPLTPLSSVEFGDRGGPSRYDFRVKFDGCMPEGFDATVYWSPSDFPTSVKLTGRVESFSGKSGSLILSIASADLLRRPTGVDAGDAFPARLALQGKGDSKRFEWPLGQIEFTANATPNRLDLGKRAQQSFSVEVKYRGGRGILNGAAWITLEKGGDPVGAVAASEQIQQTRVPFTTMTHTERSLHFDVPREVALMGVLRTPNRIWLVVQDHYGSKVDLPLAVVNIAPDEEAAARAKYAQFAPPKGGGLPLGHVAVYRHEGAWCDQARLLSVNSIGHARQYSIAARCNSSDRMGTVRSADTVLEGAWDPGTMNAVLSYDYNLGWRVTGSQKYHCDRDPWVRGTAPQCTYLGFTGNTMVLALVGVGLAQSVTTEQKIFARRPPVSAAQTGQTGGAGNAQARGQAASSAMSTTQPVAPNSSIPQALKAPANVTPSAVPQIQAAPAHAPARAPMLAANRMAPGYRHFAHTNIPECKKKCADDAQCRAWTFVKQEASCHLQNQAPKVTSQNACCESGVK
jgi:hypothetical protein